MPSALETLVKVLKLEQTTDYQDKAVIGGLKSFAAHWMPDAHAQAKKPEHHLLVDELVGLLNAYGDLSDRGMLNSTIVLVTGEFGRTPEVNANGGRDHWPGCFSVTVAGGGIEGGRVIGSSDKDGMTIKDTPVQVPDFMASIYSRLGIDYTKENLSNIGRPLRIVPDGKPLAFL